MLDIDRAFDITGYQWSFINSLLRFILSFEVFGKICSNVFFVFCLQVNLLWECTTYIELQPYYEYQKMRKFDFNGAEIGKKSRINYRERNNVHLGMWKVYLGIIFFLFYSSEINLYYEIRCNESSGYLLQQTLN